MRINLKDYKNIFIYIAIPLLLGTFVGILTSGDTSNYNNGIVPALVFPIVWTILYILMGISSYLVKDNKSLIRLY